MQKIKEVKPGAGIELMATITYIQPIRKTWKCYVCKKQGLWTDPNDFRDYCPECGAEKSGEWGKGVWLQTVTSAVIEDDSGKTTLDLWHMDVDKYKVGDKIHLVNGYAKMDGRTVKVSKGKFGAIRLLE